jgi:outer membrane protein OmpA-like peptidoglycan-associated protein
MVQKEEADDIGSAAARAAPVKPGSDDYNKYLTRAYKHAKFDKPRDFLGLTKSQPPEEMTKMLEANVTVDQDTLRHLAERRADAVRQYLRGKIADDRVFVLAPKLDAQGIEDKGKSTRADFSLHM